MNNIIYIYDPDRKKLLLYDYYDAEEEEISELEWFESNKWRVY